MRFRLFSKLILTLMALIFHTGLAFGVELSAFEDADFRKAQNEGKTIVLDFHAVWCGVCKKQQPILKALLENREFKNYVVYTVDYDWATDLNKEFNIASQATLVVLKGKEEKARATGITDRDEMKLLLLKGT